MVVLWQAGDLGQLWYEGGSGTDNGWMGKTDLYVWGWAHSMWAPDSPTGTGGAHQNKDLLYCFTSTPQTSSPALHQLTRPRLCTHVSVWQKSTNNNKSSLFSDVTPVQSRMIRSWWCEGWVGSVLVHLPVPSLGSLSLLWLWCSIMFSFIQVQLLKIQTVRSTEFLLHVNISIFLFFLLFVSFLYFIIIIIIIIIIFLFFWCLQLWPQVLKVLQSAPVQTPLMVVFHPGLVRVRSSSDVIRSGLYMALGL